MINNLPISFKNTWKTAYFKVIAVISLIALIGFSTVGHYGFSVDEASQMSMVRKVFEYITKGTPIGWDSRYYGPVFNLSSEIVFQGKQYLTQGSSYNPLSYKEKLSEEEGKVRGLAERIKVKHPMTFLVSLFAYASVAGMVGILCGVEWAWLGPIFLALFPRFWGHSFFNPKDIPFAAMFTLCTFLGAYIVDYYLQVDSQTKVGRNPITHYSILYGILLSLLTGTRIGGFVILGFILITYSLLRFRKGSPYKDIRQVGIFYLITCIVWFAFNSLWYPNFWSNPIAGFFETVAYLSKHPIPVKLLFNGQVFSAQSVPWTYIPTWMFITIPLIFQILFIIGIILFVTKYSQLSNLQRACFILVLLQVLTLPAIAIVKQSSVYDGIRQFLFTFPGIATIATVAFVWIYQTISKKSIRMGVAAFMAVLLSAICINMIALHPYQYVYFNRVSGGLQGAHNRFDTDYWGLSLREGMEWLNKNARPGSTVLVGGFIYSAQIFADPNLNVMGYDPAKTSEASKPFYYLAWPRWNAPNNLPECPVVYQVIREGTPLSIVKRCD